jgi:hypothetical protein
MNSRFSRGINDDASGADHCNYLAAVADQTADNGVINCEHGEHERNSSERTFIAKQVYVCKPITLLST